MFNDDNVPLLQVSMLNKGFGDVGDSKGASTGTTGSQFLEQYKTAQALAQLAAQHSQTGPPSTSPSWDTSGTSLGQYGELTLNGDIEGVKAWKYWCNGHFSSFSQYFNSLFSC